ncbi:MAG: hypothetical protein MJ180_01480 [Candidatus Gastranaerophilales bacterium]|nr:hypothetical protein [Candidatus Gastranaerophilales bacterium]
MEVVEPNKDYLYSYYEACKETWGNCHDNYIIHDPEKFSEWKEHIFQDYKKQEKGIDLPENYVPSATYWLVSNNEYIGTINLRLKLNQQLAIYGGHIGIVIRTSKRGGIYARHAINWAIAKAKSLNINPVLLTCQASNTLSHKGLEFLHYVKKEEDIIELYGKKQLIYRYYF